MARGINFMGANTNDAKLFSAGNRMAVRFVPDETCTIYRFFISFKAWGSPAFTDQAIADPSKPPKYGKGDGGTMGFQIVNIKPNGDPDLSSVLTNGSEIVQASTRYFATKSNYGISTVSGAVYADFPAGVDVIGGQEYAFVVRNTHADPVNNYFSVNNVTMKVSAAGPQNFNNRDPNYPNPVGRMDALEVACWSSNAGSTWVYGRNVGDYQEPVGSEDEARIPVFGYSTSPGNGTPEKPVQPYSAYLFLTSTGGVQTYPSAPRATTLTKGFGYAPIGSNVGVVTITNTTTGVTGVTASMGTGMQIGPLTPPVPVAVGQTYTARASGTVLINAVDNWVVALWDAGVPGSKLPFRSNLANPVHRIGVGATPDPWLTDPAVPPVEPTVDPSTSPPWTAPKAGEINFFRSGDASFDTYTSAPSDAYKAFMVSHYDRMRVNSPYFDSRLSWYPSAIVYKDAYALYVGQALAAAHPDWILRDGSGNPLYIPFGTVGAYQQYAADITNAAFRADWIATAKTKLALGYDGILIDDVNYYKRVATASGVETGNQYGAIGLLTEAIWQTAMADFMTQIRAAMPHAELIHNCVWSVPENATLVRGYNQATAIEVERGVIDSGITGGATGKYALRSLFAFVARRHAQGVGVVYDAQATTVLEHEYSRGCYFLASDGKDMLGTRIGGTPADWWTGYDLNLGAATSDIIVLGNGLLSRSFESGIVYVNEPGHVTVSMTDVGVLAAKQAIIVPLVPTPPPSDPPPVDPPPVPPPAPPVDTVQPGRRPWIWRGGILVSTIATVAIIVSTVLGDPTPLKAEMWIDLDGGSCTRSTEHVYDDATACPDFKSAYQNAIAGDTVKVKAGTYPDQLINPYDVVSGDLVANNKTSGERIVFRPADDETVYVGNIQVERSRVELRDFKLNNHDLTFRQQDLFSGAPVVDDVLSDGLSGRNFNFYNVTHGTLRGGEWGPASACGGPYGGSNNSIRNLNESINPSDILIENTTLHNIHSYDLINCHTECLAIFAGDRVVVKGVTFYDCSIYDIFVQNNSGPVTGLTLVNNMLGTPTGLDGAINGQTVGFSTVPQYTQLLNNSMQRAWSIDDNGVGPAYAGYVGWTMHGNAGPAQFNVCTFNQINFTYNAWTDRSACGGDGNQGNVGTDIFKDWGTLGAGFNLQLAPGTSLQNAIPVEDAHGVTVDYQRESRPRGPAIDIGADERGKLVATDVVPVATETAAPTVTSTPTPSPTATPTATPTPDPGVGGTDANIWVDTNGGSCTRSASPIAYSDATACASFNAAYGAATAGDSVLVKGGTYGAQEINGVNKTTGQITIQPADGETPLVNAGLRIRSSHVTVKDIDIGNGDLMVGMEETTGTNQPVNNVIADNVDNREIRIFGATDVTVKNSDIGPIEPDGPAGGENSKIQGWSTTAGGANPTNILIENNNFHDAQADDLVAHHIECLFIVTGANMIFRRNKFSNCSITDVFLQDFDTTPGMDLTGPITWENNWFGIARDTTAGSPGSNGKALAYCSHPVSHIVNNSFQDIISFQDCGGTFSSGTFQGNYGIANFDVCTNYGLTRSYNAWYNRNACTGVGEKGNNSSPPVTNYFVNDTAGNAFDLHITGAATPLLGGIPAGSSALTEAVDIDNEARSTNYDIGSDER